jgi:DNA polymerase-3 subunit chi
MFARNPKRKMTEVLFYHLTRSPLDKALPDLLAKCVERGWRVVVEAGSVERVEALDAVLWTFSDESFLPHGTVASGHAAAQPIFLTAGPDNPNGASVRFFVDGARIANVEALDRAILMFDGNDEDAVQDARTQWKEQKAAGHTLAYWQQGERGWEKKA